MIDRHVAHEEDESDPWHERSIYIFCYEICTCRADEKSADASPEIEEANEIEKRDAILESDIYMGSLGKSSVRYDKDVFLIGFVIR